MNCTKLTIRDLFIPILKLKIEEKMNLYIEELCSHQKNKC